jgi:hypothetical protein
VDSDQLWATGTGGRSGKARAFGEKRSGMEPCDARAVQRRTTSESENAGTARQGQQGPERGSGRPAGRASALQVDGSHRLHSQRSLVRGKEEAWSGPLAGSGTGLQVSSLARASAVHRQPGRQPGGPRIALGKVPEQQQATRPVRKEGTQHGRKRRQRRVSSSGHAESVRQRSGQRARDSGGVHPASSQGSSGMRTQWSAHGNWSRT